MTDNLSSSIWVEKLAEHISRELPETTAKKFMTLLEHAVHTADFDWKAIFHDYCIFLLRDICPAAKNPSLKAAINHIIHLHETRETDPKVWDDAATAAAATAHAATAAAATADTAAAYAVDSAASTDCAMHVIDATSNAVISQGVYAYSVTYFSTDSLTKETANTRADAAKNQAKKYAYAKIADHLLEKFNEKSS